jgi:hypothetical protein
VIDLFKYSNRNKFFNFIIKQILKLDNKNLSKPFFYKKNINLEFDNDFFYDYLNDNKITKWSGQNPGEHYQSNHDLQKLDNLKKSIKLLEKYLNTEIKGKIFENSKIGRFKIKSLWFTIQKANQGHSKHNHPKSLLSGVYYHQVDENNGGELEIFSQEKKIEYSPKKNDLIIFNSETYHSVKAYYGKNDRIAIAWDAIYTL